MQLKYSLLRRLYFLALPGYLKFTDVSYDPDAILIA